MGMSKTDVSQAVGGGIAVVILAAGKGKRMNSDLPKVLHKLGGQPLIGHVVATAKKLSPKKIVVVVGHGSEKVKAALKVEKILFAEQIEQHGTAHAVSCAKKLLDGFLGKIIVLSGDVPLIDAATLLALIKLQDDNGAGAALLTADAENPDGYGRIIRSADGGVTAIVEERDATPAQKSVREINAGIYVFDSEFLFGALEKITPDNDQKEYYLTDVVRIALADGVKVSALKTSDFSRIMGVNRPEELAALENLFNTAGGNKCPA
jgi:bifunctional UDP-N-acetylglucosamine pyrophosphorylase/glucosamine-1-phosphate N-acetyltransferase